MKIEKFNENKSKSENLNEKLADKWKKNMDFRSDARKTAINLNSGWHDNKIEDHFKILHSMLLDIMKKLDSFDKWIER